MYYYKIYHYSPTANLSLIQPSELNSEDLVPCAYYSSQKQPELSRNTGLTAHEIYLPFDWVLYNLREDPLCLKDKTCRQLTAESASVVTEALHSTIKRLGYAGIYDSGTEHTDHNIALYYQLPTSKPDCQEQQLLQFEGFSRQPDNVAINYQTRQKHTANRFAFFATHSLPNPTAVDNHASTENLNFPSSALAIDSCIRASAGRISFARDFEVKSHLSGLNKKALPVEDYLEIRAIFLNFIVQSVETNYWGAPIKIHFDDGRGIIEFGYETTDLNAIFNSLDLTALFKQVKYQYKDDKEYESPYPYQLYLYQSRQQIAEAQQAIYQRHLGVVESTPPDRGFQLGPEPEISDINVFEKIFSNENIIGCAVGEVHSHITPKKLLINSAENLKRIGITTVFSEFFLYEAHQKLLDDYLAGDSDDLPFELSQWLKYIDESSNIPSTTQYTYTNCLKALKRVGIRVVGLDSSLTLFYKKRVAGFNQVAYEVFQKEYRGGRYLLHTGVAHCRADIHAPLWDEAAVSLAGLLPNCFSLYVRDDPAEVHWAYYGDKRDHIFDTHISTRDKVPDYAADLLLKLPPPQEPQKYQERDPKTFFARI